MYVMSLGFITFENPNFCYQLRYILPEDSEEKIKHVQDEAGWSREDTGHACSRTRGWCNGHIELLQSCTNL